MTKKEAMKSLKEHGTIHLSYEDGIACQEELITIGVDTDLVRRSLFQVDYLSRCIAWDEEDKHEEFEMEYSELTSHLDKFDLDYEIGGIVHF